jgi:hypothetical protein
MICKSSPRDRSLECFARSDSSRCFTAPALARLTGEQEDIDAYFDVPGVSGEKYPPERLADRMLSDHAYYHPLHAGKQIRLIELEPGSSQSPLYLRFRHMDLERHHGKYEALSYAWGVKGPKSDIWLYNQLLEITKNLEQALRSLRLSHQTRYLWCDAICINQDDIEERQHQVSIMSHIYSQATSVIVWLGPESQNCELPQIARGNPEFSAACAIVNQNQAHVDEHQKAYYAIVDAQGVRHRRVDVPNSPESAFFNSKGNPLPAFWLPIVELFNRSWFWRLWVFQEITLARTAVARIGSAELDWRWIGRAAALLRTRYHGICNTLSIGGVFNAYLMFRCSRQSDLEAIQPDFMRLLRLTRQFEVSDPRDRVYGLLGIRTPDNRPGEGLLFMQPDYKLSVNELWRKIALKALNTTTDLSLFSCVQPSSHEELSRHFLDQQGFARAAESSASSLPSWVPRWDVARVATLSPWEPNESFHAAKGYARAMRILTTNDVLCLRGVACGLIVLTIPPNLDDLQRSFLRRDGPDQYFQTGCGAGLLATTLAAGTNVYGSIASAKWSDIRQPAKPSEAASYAKSNSDSHTDLPVFKEKSAAISSHLCDKRYLFLTSNGFLGLGSETIREGDVLCVLGGGETPFILRQVRSLDASHALENHRPVYGLLGECYVEGLMRGEAINHLASGKCLQGPVPLDTTLQGVLNKWRKRRQSIEKARVELASVASQKLTESWFNIR